MNPNEVLKLAKEALQEAIKQKKLNQEFISSLGPAIVDTLKPILNEIADNSKIPKDEILKAIAKIQIPEIIIPKPEITYNAPDVIIPPIKVPKSEFHFDASKIRIPDIKMPDEMDIKGWVSIMGYDRGLLSDPFPVQLRDAKGNPVRLFENLTQILQGGGGGGKSDFFTIKGFSASAYADYLNADNRLRVSVESGGGGLTDAELRASPLQTQQVSGYADSVNVITTVGLTDAQLRASTLDTKQVSGSVNSVVVNDVLVSVPVFQVSGTSFSVVANIGLSDSELRASALDVRQVSGSINSINVVSSITLETIQVSGSINSTQAKLIARQTNPTAVADGASAFASSDDLGRQVMRLHQVRDLIQTAYVSIANGTETTLRAAVAGAYLDLIYIMGSNNSDVAVTVDIRAVTAGGVMMTLQIPANGVAGVSLPIPIPQQETGNNWTADLPDITGTTVYLSALFSQEV